MQPGFDSKHSEIGLPTRLGNSQVSLLKWSSDKSPRELIDIIIVVVEKARRNDDQNVGGENRERGEMRGDAQLMKKGVVN